MTRGLPVRGWLPIAIVGAAAATVAELTAGLLLYASEGFIRSLTLILTVEMMALAVGLWTAPVWPRAAGSGSWGPDEEFVDDGVESLRRRWSLLLMVFAVAALYAGMWGMLRSYAATPLSQGLGLGLMGALPLFAVGGLLGRMVTWEARRGPDRRRVGAPAALGASLGFLVSGLYLIPRLSPLSIILLCLICLSAGALLFGQALDRRINPVPDPSRDLEPIPDIELPPDTERVGAGEASQNADELRPIDAPPEADIPAHPETDGVPVSDALAEADAEAPSVSDALAESDAEAPSVSDASPETDTPPRPVQDLPPPGGEDP